MKYSKPEFIVEEFMPNVAVAACNREWNGETSTEWDEQPITCCRQGETTDYIFGSTEVCNYVPCHMKFFESGKYTVAQLNAGGLNIKGSGGNVTVPAGGGYVLCWEDTAQGANHYGPATPEIVKIMTSSF